MPEEPGKRLSLSIVSHGHGALVGELLGDIARHCRDVEVWFSLALTVAPRSERAIPHSVK